MGNHKIKTMTTRGLQLGAVSLLSAAISACGGGNGTTGGETPSSSSSSVVSSISSSVASSSSSSVVSSVSSSSSSSVSSSSVPSSSSSSSVAPSSSSSSSSSSSEASGGDIASGAALFVEQCTLCHSDLGNGTYSFIDPNNLVKIVAPYSLSVEGMAQYITEQMPKDVPSLGFHPDQCVDQCATDTAAFIWSLRDDSGEGSSSSASSSSVASSSSSSSSSSSVASGEDFVVLYAVNAGGSAFTAADGTPFSADRYFAMGSLGGKPDAIADTEDDTLYQSERYGMFSYNFPVAAGSYDVSLHMVETWFDNGGTPGNRLFDVKVEGETLVDDFNPLAVAGPDTAHVIELPSIEVTDGELTLEFEASMDMANVAAIVVRGLEGSKGPEPEVDPGTAGTLPVPADCSGESAVTENDFVMIDGGQLQPAVGDAITMHGNWVTGNKWNAGAVLSVTDTDGGSAISFSNAGMYEGFKMFPSPRRPFTFTGIDLWIDAETGGQNPMWGLRVITPRDPVENVGGASYTTWMRAGGTDLLSTTSECNLMSLSLPDSWIPEDGAKHFIWETKNGWQQGYSLNIRRMVLKDFRYID